MNAKQKKALELLLYPVQKVKSVDILPGYDFTPQQEYAIVVDKGEAGKVVVNHCSKQYHLVPNSEFIKPIMETFKGQDVTYKVTNKLDSRFTLDVIFNTNMVQVGKNDPVVAKLRIKNSYDGRVRYSLDMGFHRLVCSNGLTVPIEGMEEFNTSLIMRHTPALGEIINRENLLEMVNGFAQNAKDLVKPFKQLNSRKVTNLEERIMEVVENTKFSKKRAEDVLDRVQAEMVELKAKAPTDWLVYNGFNFQLNHADDLKMDEHKKERLDAQVMNFLLEN